MLLFLVDYIDLIPHRVGPVERLPIHTEAKELNMSSAVTTQVTDLQNYVNVHFRFVGTRRRRERLPCLAARRARLVSRVACR